MGNLATAVTDFSLAMLRESVTDERIVWVPRSELGQIPLIRQAGAGYSFSA
jgi:hypothetical protein